MKIKWYHIIWVILCSLITIGITGLYGWSVYCTITARPGLNGEMYMYYKLSREQYALYKASIVLTTLVIMFFQIKYLIAGNDRLLQKTIWTFIIFMGVIILFESLLSLRFVGKG